jgi:hypothetical protein
MAHRTRVFTSWLSQKKPAGQLSLWAVQTWEASHAPKLGAVQLTFPPTAEPPALGTDTKLSCLTGCVSLTQRHLVTPVDITPLPSYLFSNGLSKKKKKKKKGISGKKSSADRMIV